MEEGKPHESIDRPIHGCGRWRFRRHRDGIARGLAGKIFEFPFKLPPKKGELLLQERQ